MDESTNELMSQLKDRLINVSDGQIAGIIREARDEAFAEAKALLKRLILQAVLEHALDQLAGASKPRLETGAGVNVTPESEEQIRREIEAIRRQIAENERLLSQVKASPTETEKVPAPPVEEDEPPAESEYGYYVYGIVGRNSCQHIEGLPEAGIDPAHPVYSLPYQAIQAIVSRVSLREFGQEALEANLNDLKWLEAKVHAHQGVLETVLASRTLIPMKFCTIYRSESRVQEMLAQHYSDFVDVLNRLDGKKEWGVKVYCDARILAQRVGEINDRVKELKTEIATKSSGMAYFMKKKLEETTDEEMERASDECAQRSHDRLSSYAKEAVINPLQSKEITSRKEEMILNGAYLVAEEQLAAFRAGLASLEEEYGDLGFSFEMTGPWPPYNFVTLPGT
jgi:archaellum component FlaC